MFKQVGVGYRLNSRTTKGHAYIRLMFNAAEMWDITLDDLMRNCQLHENFVKGKGEPGWVIMAPIKNKTISKLSLKE